MKLNVRYSLMLVALAGVSAMAASAQSLRGTFELPQAAYWNNTMLPAGEYKLVVESQGLGVSLISVHGEGLDATWLAATGSREESAGSSYLKLDSVNGTYVIRELETNVLNRSYKFGVPKKLKESAAVAGSTAPAQTVAISSGY